MQRRLPQQLSLKGCILLFILQSALILSTGAAETATTQGIVPAAQTTKVTQAPPPKEEPKVVVKDSALCKKCSCIINPDHVELDCSQKLPQWLTDDDWNTLQKGDVTFETIRLEHNNYTTVEGFRTYGVKNLYLGFNQIVKIPDASFQNLTELRRLDLSYNKLTSKDLKPDAFKGLFSKDDYLPLGKVQVLNLGHNDLHVLDDDLFEHLPQLEELVLCKNTFKVIDHQTEIAITGLHSLQILDLSYMELEDLPNTLFFGPRDLHTLILTGNLFDEIPNELKNAPNLQKLVMDENPIEDLTGENIFPKLPLTYLSLTSMPHLTKIGEGALSQLQNLEELIISDNQRLNFIHPRALANKTANPHFFDYPPIKQLYLNNNNLTTIDDDLLIRWDKVETIDLRYNPWACDCSNDWLIEVLLPQINSTTPKLIENLECKSPDEWKARNMLTLATEEPKLNCQKYTSGHSDALFIGVGLLIGIIVGVPLTIGTLIFYRRYTRNYGSAVYNRASFADDFHI